MKGLRGTRFDPFGLNAERAAERKLIEDYFLVVDSVNWTDTDPRPDVTYVCGMVRYSVTAL